MSKASHLLTRVRTFLYSLPSLATPVWVSYEAVERQWGSNTASQEVLIIGTPPPFSPSVVARQQVRETPDILHVCVVFLVGEGGGGVQIRVVVEEPWGYFINLHGESFLFLLDKTLSALSF